MIALLLDVMFTLIPTNQAVILGAIDIDFSTILNDFRMFVPVKPDTELISLFYSKVQHKN